MLFAGTAAHALLAKLMYGHGYPRGAGAAPEDLEVAAVMMYYGGDLAELLLAVLLFAAWYRRRPSSGPLPVTGR